VLIESFWDGGSAVYDIDVAVHRGVTALRTLPPAGGEKRIIVTQDNVYIWYDDDATPYVGEIGTSGDKRRTADEFQMLNTYEDILELSLSDIIDAGSIEYEGEDFIFIAYLSRHLGYTGNYYVSIDLGLVIRAEEFDENGELVYRMTAGETITGETDPAMFTLPDGTILGTWD
jgi:hypothetical protein